MMRQAMRLTTWNCARGGVDECLSRTEPLDAELVTLQECKPPPRDDPAVIWGRIETNLGTAVISRRPELTLEEIVIPSLHPTVVPVVVEGPAPFLFVGVWTHRPYNKVAQDSLTACAAAASGLPIVAAGDFNSSPALKSQRRKPLRFLDWMRDELGLVSAYHQFFGETPGEETHATYYQHRAESKPFHIDYCFLPESWSSRISWVKVGSYAERWESDHRPLTVELRESPAA